MPGLLILPLPCRTWMDDFIPSDPCTINVASADAGIPASRAANATIVLMMPLVTMVLSSVACIFSTFAIPG
jgi:hypothetical protein